MINAEELLKPRAEKCWKGLHILLIKRDSDGPANSRQRQEF